MEAELPPPLFLRFALRPWLRLSLPLSLRGPVEPKGRYRAPQRGLRAWRFADIPTPLPIQNTTKEVIVMFSIHFLSASPALDTCATTSALVRQRLCSTSPSIARCPGGWRELAGRRSPANPRSDRRGACLHRRASRPLHRPGARDPLPGSQPAPHSASSLLPAAGGPRCLCRCPPRSPPPVVPDRARR